MNKIVIWIYPGLPDLLKFVFVVAFADDDIERLRLCRETQGLMKSAVNFPGLSGRFPLAIDAAETAGPGNFARVGIHDRKRILTAKRRVNRLQHVA